MAIINKILTGNDPTATWTMSGPGSLLTGVLLVDNNDGTANFSWDSATETTTVSESITFRLTETGGAFSEETVLLLGHNEPIISPDMNVTGITVTNLGLQSGPGVTPGTDQVAFYAIQGFPMTRTLVAQSTNPTANLVWDTTIVWDATQGEPAGVTLVDNGDGSAAITWLPTAFAPNYLADFIGTMTITDTDPSVTIAPASITLTFSTEEIDNIPSDGGPTLGLGTPGGF